MLAIGLAVMSIDLGSESIKIAIVSPGKPMEVILNVDSQRKTPLAVGFRDGDRFFGEAAMSTVRKALTSKQSFISSFISLHRTADFQKKFSLIYWI